MKRWLALLLLLTPCGGCMLLDDMRYDAPPSGYTQGQTPSNSCGAATGIVNVSQTVEPELLKR